MVRHCCTLLLFTAVLAFRMATLASVASPSKALGFTDSHALVSAQPACKQSSVRPQIRYHCRIQHARKELAFFVTGRRGPPPLSHPLVIKEHRLPR